MLGTERNGYCYQPLSVANRINDCHRTFEYGVLGRGNDVRISKVGKSLASNPASRHQARSSFAMDGNSRLAFFSLAFHRPFLPTWDLFSSRFYSRHVCSEKNCSRALCPVLGSARSAPSPRLSFFASCAWIRSWSPRDESYC